MIKLEAPVALCITSYEVDENGSTPTLSHIFYGEDLDQAKNIALSHLKSDLFFSSSFVGEMKWKDDFIYIEYGGQIYSQKLIKNKKETLNKLLKKLEKEGKLINKKQHKLKIVEQVNKLSLQ